MQSAASGQEDVLDITRQPGVTVDPGEPRAIRTDFATDEERRAAAHTYFTETFGSQLAAAHADTEEHLERALKVANMFRFIGPSHHIPEGRTWRRSRRGCSLQKSGGMRSTR